MNCLESMCTICSTHLHGVNNFHCVEPVAAGYMWKLRFQKKSHIRLTAHQSFVVRQWGEDWWLTSETMACIAQTTFLHCLWSTDQCNGNLWRKQTNPLEQALENTEAEKSFATNKEFIFWAESGWLWFWRAGPVLKRQVVSHCQSELL